MYDEDSDDGNVGEDGGDNNNNNNNNNNNKYYTVIRELDVTLGIFIA